MLRVGIKVTEEHDVIIIFECVAERKGIMDSNFFFRLLLLVIAIVNHIQLIKTLKIKLNYLFVWNVSGIRFVFEVTHIKSPSMPASLSRIVFLLRKHAHLHSLVIERINFEKIDDRDLDGHSLFASHYREIEPLTVILTVSVSIQVYHILEFSLPDRLLKIPALELRIK
jgi:hypothetical protein